MEPRRPDELSDDELDALLPEWKSPAAPASLRAGLFPQRPWWRSLWTASLRVPVPALLVLAVLIALAVWPSRPRQGNELQPVAELRPRIIRSQNAQN